MKIAIVDNDRALLRSLEILLGAEGHDVRAFPEAKLALESLGAAAKDAWPDLLLIDYMMPVMTGIDFLRELRRRRSFSCACIVITAHSNQFSRDELHDLGVECVLEKPLDLDRLLARISVQAATTGKRTNCSSQTDRTNGEDDHERS